MLFDSNRDIPREMKLNKVLLVDRNICYRKFFKYFFIVAATRDLF